MLIRDAMKITSQWLTERLREKGVLRDGEVTAITVLEEQSDLGVFARMVRLGVEYGQNATGILPASLYLKISKEDQHEEHLVLGKSEIQFYQAVQDLADALPLPRFYDGYYDAATGHSHVLMEDMSPTHFQQPAPLPPSSEHCLMLAESLAKVHALWWDSPQLGVEIGEPYDADKANMQIERFYASVPAFMDYVGAALMGWQREVYERILASDVLARRTRRQAERDRVTLVHGDTHQGNFMLPKDSAKNQVVLIDWHRYDIDIGLADMAFLIANRWTTERRAEYERDMVRCYHRTLRAGGVEGYDWQACWRDYRECVILLPLIPVGQLRRKQHPGVVWGGVERGTAAFRDLDCGELL